MNANSFSVEETSSQGFSRAPIFAYYCKVHCQAHGQTVKEVTLFDLNWEMSKNAIQRIHICGCITYCVIIYGNNWEYCYR